MSKAQVAALSVERITRMNSGELIETILSAELPRMGGADQFEIHRFDLKVLKSMAMRARKICRQQGY